MARIHLEPDDPRRIGEYGLWSRLGSGGQGVVFEAYSAKGQRVALKTFPPGAATELPVGREVDAAMRVGGPNVAKILGFEPRGRHPYIASELIVGPSLAEAVALCPLRGHALHDLALGVANALASIHNAGVVHRDLKPQNVLLGRDGPRVVDFGLARIVSDQTRSTHALPGTLMYMSPELFGQLKAGPAADVFAWGALLIFAATGRHAFERADEPATMNAILHDHPDSGAIPQYLRGLVDRALAKDPASRPTARQICAELSSTTDIPGSEDFASQDVSDSTWPTASEVATEAYYRRLTPEQRKSVPAVLLRMVKPDWVTRDSRGGGDTEYRALELTQADFAGVEHLDSTVFARVVDVFTGAGIVLRRRDNRFAISEAVLLTWPELRAWLMSEGREHYEFHRIREAANRWNATGRHLFDEVELSQATQWTTQPHLIELNGVEKKFVAASSESVRRRARIRRGVIAGLTILSIVAIVFGITAYVQRNQAVEQTRIAESRLMASASENMQATNTRAAMLLAVAAYRTNPTEENRAALLRADLNSPNLVRYLTAGAQVAVLDSSADGHTIVAGLSDGHVVRWRLPGSTAAESLITLPTAVTALAVSADGAVIVATDASHMALWRNGSGQAALDVPDGYRTGGPIGISPSGKTVAVDALRPLNTSCGLTTGCPDRINIYDTATTTLVAQHDNTWEGGDFTLTTDIVVPSDSKLLLFDRGMFVRMKIDGWSTEIPPKGILLSGSAQSTAGPSADGGWFGANSFGTGTLPVWRMDGATDYRNPDMVIDVPRPASAEAPVLSRSGKTAAGVYRDGGLYLAPVAPAGALPAAVEMHGTESVTLLRFLGSSEHQLISAYQNRITLWDTDQSDRLATTFTQPILRTCVACNGPSIAFAPDDSKVLIASGYTIDDRAEAIIQPLHEPAGSFQEFPNSSGIPLWRNNEQPMILGPPASEPEPQVSPSLPTIPAGEEKVLAAGIGADPGTVVSVGKKGTIYLQDINTGAIRGTIPGPPEIEPGEEVLETAAIDPTGSLVAIDYRSTVSIIDTNTRREIRRIPGDAVTKLLFAGSHLVVRRHSDLEIWTEDGSARQQTITSNEPYGESIRSPSLAADRSGTILAHVDATGSVIIVDRAAGATLATIPTANAGRDLETTVAVSSDGRYIVTASNYVGGGLSNGLVERDISPEALINTACIDAGQDLTSDEWHDWMGIERPATASCPGSASAAKHLVSRIHGRYPH